MRIAFWNLHNKYIANLVMKMIEHYQIDIIGISENDNFDDNVLLKAGYNILQINGKIKVITKINRSIIEIISESNRYTFLQLLSPINGKIIICFCHLVDRINFKSDTARGIETQNFKSELLRLENIFNTKQSLIFGDFNINPYEGAMTNPGFLNATFDPNIALKRSRVIQNVTYEYLFNPMWKFYNSINRPLGTFYLKNPGLDEIHWNILDNILLRPSLIDKTDIDSIKLITSIGDINLLKNDRIINSDISDHLPILADFIL